MSAAGAVAQHDERGLERGGDERVAELVSDFSDKVSLVVETAVT
jgi:hypothetical protein